MRKILLNMEFLGSLKKYVAIKQNAQNHDLTKIRKRILKLEKELESDSNNVSFLVQLYGCYVEISDIPKKIEYMEKMVKLRPKDSYPLQQLADIYSNELDDMKMGKYYQDRANRISKFL